MLFGESTSTLWTSTVLMALVPIALFYFERKTAAGAGGGPDLGLRRCLRRQRDWLRGRWEAAAPPEPVERVPLSKRVESCNRRWRAELPATGAVSLATQHILQWSSTTASSSSGSDAEKKKTGPTSGYLWVGEADDELLEAKRQVDRWVRRRRLQPLSDSGTEAEAEAGLPASGSIDLAGGRRGEAEGAAAGAAFEGGLPGLGLPASLVVGAAVRQAARPGPPVEIDEWLEMGGRAAPDSARLLSAGRHEVWELEGDWWDDAQLAAGRLVAKVFHTELGRYSLPGGASVSASLEIEAARLAAAGGLQTPTVFGSGYCPRAGHRCSWAVFAHVSGAARPAGSSGRRAEEVVWRPAVEAMLALRQVPLPPAGSPSALPRYASGGAFAAALAALAVDCGFEPARVAAGRLVARLAAPDVPELPPALLHGDLQLDNMVLAGGKKTGLVAWLWDWEHAAIGDPRLELALLAARAAKPADVWALYGQRVAAESRAGSREAAAEMLGPRQPWEQLNDLSDVLLALTARRRAEAAASELGAAEFEPMEEGGLADSLPRIEFAERLWAARAAARRLVEAAVMPAFGSWEFIFLSPPMLPSLPAQPRQHEPVDVALE
jgi:aminoglycoside phosphotransferase (APT) family kinase protein